MFFSAAQPQPQYLAAHNKARSRQYWTVAAILLVPPFTVLGLLAWLN